jgi:hypothetical protein
MSSDIHERKHPTTSFGDKPIGEIVRDKPSNIFEKESLTEHFFRPSAELKYIPRNHVEIKLFLSGCLTVALLLVIWLMLEFKSPQYEFGAMPKVSPYLATYLSEANI